MKKLFTEYDGISEKIYLNEEQSRHITKSLRMKKGDMLTVCTGDGNDYGCIIDDINKDGARLAVCYKQASDSEADIKVSLYQGVPKGDKFEDIIQKCTELGVYEIIPVLTKRCVSRPQEKQAEKNRKAAEAAKAGKKRNAPVEVEEETLIDLVENDEVDEKALSQKEINRMKLAAARRRDAERYGEEYVEVSDEDLE